MYSLLFLCERNLIFIEDNLMPKDFIFAKTVATIFLNPEDKLCEKRFDALKKVYGYMNWFTEQGFSDAVVDTIMSKKAEMILGAKTVKDLKEIADPAAPTFDGAKWYPAPNSVPEEEMLMWSIASSRAPLRHEAVKRFSELFKNFYGWLPD